MRNSSRSAGKLLSLALCAACVLASPCRAQGKRTPPLSPEEKAARVSVADGLSLLEKIKEVESPAFRAYLYANVAAGLWRYAGDDQTLRRVAADVAAEGLADISRHEREIPPAPAVIFHGQLLDIVRRHSREEAERLERAHPLQPRPQLSERDMAATRLHVALRRLDDPKTSAQALEEALRLIGSGTVPVPSLYGQLMYHGIRNSAALPQLLSAALALEERSAGTIPLVNLFFLAQFYLRDTTPAELRARFLAASVVATRAVTAEQRGDPRVFNWAVQLLRAVHPHLQKSNDPLHAEAAARLADFAPNALRADEVYNRIRESADPLAEALRESDAARDPRTKRELRETAARHAKQQGKLRQAVELMASTEEEGRAPSQEYSPRDDFLDGVLQDALARKDVEVAKYAASKMALPVNRAAAAHRLARHSFEAKDAEGLNEHLNEAVKALRDAPEGTGKAVAYLRLAADSAEFDAARAPEILREALKAANDIPRPREDPKGEASWRLFPVADAVTAAFRRLARTDRASANGLTSDLRPKEFRVAATLGVYGDPSK